MAEVPNLLRCPSDGLPARMDATLDDLRIRSTLSQQTEVGGLLSSCSLLVDRLAAKSTVCLPTAEQAASKGVSTNTRLGQSWFSHLTMSVGCRRRLLIGGTADSPLSMAVVLQITTTHEAEDVLTMREYYNTSRNEDRRCCA